jgi:proteasome accessory factor C
MRVFRLDRIEDVTLLDEPASVPDGVQLRDLSEGVFQPASEHLLVDLRLGRAYAWVADYYPAEDVIDEGAEVRVSLRVADPGWVRALVLGSAGQVEVLSPEWLAEGIRAEAARALTVYTAK